MVIENTERIAIRNNMPKFVNPSRQDARNLTRSEKGSLLFLMNTVSALMFGKEDLKNRAEMIENGTERFDAVCDMALKLLDDIRTTIPERQQMSLNNTVHDYDLRLVPKIQPQSTAVVVDKKEFKTLVDAAQIKCRECVHDSNEAKRCELYKLLVTILPLDEYPEMFLCPYNMAGWEN